jgi:SAM-dependent methyltransferase
VTDTWAGLADQFLDYYATVRGRVRTHLIDRQLRAHLGPAPAELVDVGGGAGHQALPLARSGYRVTVVEPSAGMLDRARELLAGESADVRARVTLVQAGGEDAVAAVDRRRFAAVLCHGVIQYVDDPAPLVASLAELADDGAPVSVVAKNQVGNVMAPALAGRWADALAAFRADRHTCGLGVEARGDTVDGLTAALADQGVDPVRWYGVGFFTDWWDPTRPADTATDELLQLELEAAARDPYRGLGRMFHIVGTRRPR